VTLRLANWSGFTLKELPEQGDQLALSFPVDREQVALFHPLEQVSQIPCCGPRILEEVLHPSIVAWLPDSNWCKRL